MKAFLVSAAIVVLFIGSFVWLETCHVAGTVVDSANGVIDKTLDSNNVIYNYEYFQAANQDIMALTAKISDADKGCH